MSEPARESTNPTAAARGAGRGALAAAVVLVVLGVPAAWATRPVATLTLSGGPATLAAGQVVTVHWRGLPAGAGECELLLLLDDGAAATVRVTEQLDPERGVFAWTVPNLASASARLAIRFSRGRGEEPGPSTAPFRIVGRPAPTVQAVRYRAGEWWAAGGPVTSIGPPETSCRWRPQVRADRPVTDVAEAEWPGRSAVVDRNGASSVRPARRPDPASGAPVSVLGRCPRTVPLRT